MPDNVEISASSVDPRRRVRVFDASIMPTITSGNSASPTVMIAEKGAAAVIEDRGRDHLLPAPVGSHRIADHATRGGACPALLTSP